MNIFVVTLFPEIFSSFISTSLIEKAIWKQILKFTFVNPRDFCLDKNRQIDDEIYGWGAWLLIRARPMIDALNSVIKDLEGDFNVVYLAPSEKIFDQEKAFELSKIDNLIFVCGRYEGIDHRFERYFMEHYPDNFEKISIWKYVLLGWEVAAMTIIEATTRLVKWVIKEQLSWEDESYSCEKDMSNIEYPQYTRPSVVYWMSVPEVLLSWHAAKIKAWRDNNEITLKKSSKIWQKSKKE